MYDSIIESVFMCRSENEISLVDVEVDLINKEIKKCPDVLKAVLFYKSLCKAFLYSLFFQFVLLFFSILFGNVKFSSFNIMNFELKKYSNNRFQSVTCCNISNNK